MSALSAVVVVAPVAAAVVVAAPVAAVAVLAPAAPPASSCLLLPSLLCLLPSKLPSVIQTRVSSLGCTRLWGLLVGGCLEEAL